MTLVSILGDFHSSVLPVFYELRKQISKHIIIYDDYKCDVKEAQRLIKGIKTFSKKEKLDIKTLVHCIDEDSFEAIEKTIIFIDDNVKKKNKLVINVTDGLSNVNILLSQHFLKLDTQIISYDRFDNHCNIITKNSMKTYKLDKSIPILDHFMLKDIQVDSTSSKKYAKKYQNQIKNIFQNYKEEFKEFANYVFNDTNPNLKNKKFKNINPIMEQLGITNPKKDQMLITGGLFEYYIYLLIKELEFDDIELGVQVKQYIDGINFIPNEFDILIMKENHLHMIECKYTKNVKLEQLVYKYMALKNIIDDDGKIVMVAAHEEFKPSFHTQNPTDFLPHKRAMENKMMLLGDPLQNTKLFVKTVQEFLEI
ncbi:MAG: DUF1887 family protein [Campylobacterales bacterium]|nr:DUF1887 family protein [Campylobacterales bacterium]